MNKKTARQMLDAEELSLIRTSYGVGSPPPDSQETAPSWKQRMNASELRKIRDRALRKLRSWRLDQLLQLPRAD
jgi:hypothetical protein